MAIDNISNLDEMVVVAFVQNNSTLEIYQAATTDTTSQSVSVQEFLSNKNEFDFMLYPNPAKVKTNIILNNLTEGLTLDLYEFSGKHVYSEDIANHSNFIEINTKPLKSGLYFVKISDNKSVIKTKKLVIQ